MNIIVISVERVRIHVCCQFTVETVDSDESICSICIYKYVYILYLLYESICPICIFLQATLATFARFKVNPRTVSGNNIYNDRRPIT